MQTQLSDPTTVSPGAMETLLAPIEKPRGLMMKLAYRASRRQFGKVLAPLTVCFCASAGVVWNVLWKGRPAG